MVSSAPKPAESQKRRSSDPISWYLSSIGRVPLLTPAEEIELGNQVAIGTHAFPSHVIGHDDNDVGLIGKEGQGQEARKEEQGSFHYLILG